MGRYGAHLKAGCTTESRFAHLISECSKCYVHLLPPAYIVCEKVMFSVGFYVHQGVSPGPSLSGGGGRGVLHREGKEGYPLARTRGCGHAGGLSCLRRKFVQRII